MSVYTRFGDKGNTSLFGGMTVSKTDPRIETCGNLDELNSSLGVVVARIKDKKIKEELLKIQKDIFEIGAIIARPSLKKEEKKYFLERVKEFEKIIDNLTKKLPELENFILPGGGETGSLLHLSRTIARRAERRIVGLSEHDVVNEEILVYINRLSDLLFTFARYINFKEKKKENIWSR